MSVVLAIEEIEKGGPGSSWIDAHRGSVVLIKQVLCMTALPGFLLLMFGGEASRWTSKERAVALVVMAVMAATAVYLLFATRP